MVGHSPEHKDGTSDEKRLAMLNARVFDCIRVGGCIRWRMEVLDFVYTNVVATMGMLAPTKVHFLRIRIVELVVVACCPLYIDSCAFSPTEAVVETHSERTRVEEVV